MAKKTKFCIKAEGSSTFHKALKSKKAKKQMFDGIKAPRSATFQKALKGKTKKNWNGGF